MNIIILTIDTLRADHLECYGYQGVKTPNINRLAYEGVLFENVICQTPLTFPSHCSIFTGTYPLFHGVRDNGSFYLEENQITLAEILKNRGYTTGAFIGAFVLDSRWGLDQGFDYYYDNFDLAKYKTISLDAVQRRGNEVLSVFYEWLDKNLERKFFAWIHFYDPHTPYDPPEPYKTYFKGRRYGLYDGEIAFVDKLIGEFYDYLKKKKILDKTLIVFTSDHGESLGEHRESAHGFFIYDAVLKVPLIIRFPESKFSGKRIINQIRSIDIMPTILNLIDINIPRNVQGESLLSFILNKGRKKTLLAYSETYWPRYHYGWSELKSLRTNRYKFIKAPKPELYDLLSDPRETINLFYKKKSILKKMKKELANLIEKYSSPKIEEIGPRKIDSDSLIKLQALGYLGAFHAPLKKEKGKLADPKDKIDLYNEIKLAQFLVTEEKFSQAEKKIKEVLKKDKNVLEAYYTLGNIYFRQKKYNEAIEEYKKALRVDPNYYEAIWGLALTYKTIKKYEEAIGGFKQLIEFDPKDKKPYMHLGDIFYEKGEIDKAIEYLKKGLELDPESPIFHNKLGACYIKKQMYDKAEKAIRTALRLQSPLLNAHFNLALIHEAKGEYEQAIYEYRKEQETCPFNYRPDFNLGLLYMKLGKINIAIKEFESCIEKKNDFPKAYIFLAKMYMDLGENLTKAEKLVIKGLKLKPDLKTTILAHFVLADIYNRMGKYEESKNHVDLAKQLKKNLIK
ncbi:sulfatase-like hydrolase/transferase [Candidatus Aminicenantes bacterium AC-335-A11]|nr:sulfatase-like hydrolase/transferase [SCandidatus Aminicenantes bacterium Aminicenantia_JdfR_composite]MCP2618407.1 sulfatase-like hydrolase/transferase [Candidatus Aminicenantes bacterium AC-335-A11]